MPDKMTILVHSGDHDKLYGAMIVATGALAMGLDVSMFFTFYGLERLKKDALDKGPVSRFDLFGSGKRAMVRRMKAANSAPLQQLVESYKELGGRIIACEMALPVLGLAKEDLREDWIDGYAGVGQLIEEIKGSVSTLFV